MCGVSTTLRFPGQLNGYANYEMDNDKRDILTVAVTIITGTSES